MDDKKIAKRALKYKSKDRKGLEKPRERWE